MLAYIRLKARWAITTTDTAQKVSFTKKAIVVGMWCVPRKTREDHHKRKTHTAGTFLLPRTGSKMRTMKFDTIHRAYNTWRCRQNAGLKREGEVAGKISIMWKRVDISDTSRLCGRIKCKGACCCEAAGPSWMLSATLQKAPQRPRVEDFSVNKKNFKKSKQTFFTSISQQLKTKF